MKALIIDDHDYTSEGIARLLNDNFEMTKVGRAKNYDEAIKLIESTKWDFITLDINLPGKSGLELLKTIRRKDRLVPVLIISMVQVSQYGRRVLQAGATGYITKGEPAEELLKAVRMVLKGYKYYSPIVQQDIPELMEDKLDQPKHHLLSDREFEIFREVALGKSLKEIALERNLTLNTVCSYRRRVFQKLNAKTNYDLMKYAFRYRIID